LPRLPLREWLLSWVHADVAPRDELDSLPGVMWHLSDAWRRREQPNVVLVHYDDLATDLEARCAVLPGCSISRFRTRTGPGSYGPPPSSACVSVPTSPRPIRPASSGPRCVLPARDVRFGSGAAGRRGAVRLRRPRGAAGACRPARLAPPRDVTARPARA
jgi:hypothetical protein